jgi:hypothetical protein
LSRTEESGSEASESEAIRVALRRAFGETADPASHVPRAATDATLAALFTACRHDGPGSTVTALIAPPGYGRTHLLRVIEARLCATRAIAAARNVVPIRGDLEARGIRGTPLYLPYAALELPDLVHWIHGLLGAAPPARARDEAAELGAMASLMALAEKAGSPLRLLIDDADSMPAATLRALALGLARESSPVRLVLALSDDSRSTRTLAAFDAFSPLELPYRTPLDEAETEAYLRARLSQAGLPLALLDDLDPITVARIRALSGGIPRRIHRVVNALLEPEREALARALASHPRSDAWLGRPMEEIL